MERYYGRHQKCRLGSVPEIRKEQVPSADETAKERLYGDGDRG
jgi:hypothetical protein